MITGFFGLRYAFNHPNIALKVLGGTVMAVGLVSGLFLNLFVAHFRDAVETGLIAATAAGTMAEFSMFDISPATVMSSMFPNIIGLESFIAMGPPVHGPHRLRPRRVRRL